jgi:hypothetical protein
LKHASKIVLIWSGHFIYEPCNPKPQKGPLPSESSRDPAAVDVPTAHFSCTLQTGTYTAILKDANGSNGIGLIEFYEY